jgi:hypothetical protein
MDSARSRWLRVDSHRLQTPVAYLVCNFSSPVGDKPALLTHDELTTLFHEFGHGLHHMLTQVDEMGVSGIDGVEWDAVELPSQFMENFCWEWDVIRRLSAHVDSGEPLPRALFDKMLAAKNFQSGLQTLRQVEFGLFDMRLHTEADAAERVQAILAEVRQEVALVPVPPFSRTAHTFSHIFAGGYSAGYYSYKWAEVLSADAWSAFEEEGVLNPETGRRYRREILEAGGARPPSRASRPSAAASRASTRCCATRAWPEARARAYSPSRLIACCHDTDVPPPALSALLLTPAPLAMAQYKVIGPDGKVTYTDRPPTSSQAQVQMMSPNGAVGSAVPNWRPCLPPAPAGQPLSGDALRGQELRALRCRPRPAGAARHPFCREAGGHECRSGGLCEVQRWPHPALLTVGSQQIKSGSLSDWNSYLDAAGYPKTSALPASYRRPMPTPLAGNALPPAPSGRGPGLRPRPGAWQHPNIRFGPRTPAIRLSGAGPQASGPSSGSAAACST